MRPGRRCLDRDQAPLAFTVARQSCRSLKEFLRNSGSATLRLTYAEAVNDTEYLSENERCPCSSAWQNEAKRSSQLALSSCVWKMNLLIKWDKTAHKGKFVPAWKWLFWHCMKKELSRHFQFRTHSAAGWGLSQTLGQIYIRQQRVHFLIKIKYSLNGTGLSLGLKWFP